MIVPAARSPLPGLVVLALGVATVWLVLTPFAWDNDEQGHYWTARDIYTDGHLPSAADFPSIIVPQAPREGAGLFRYHALPPTYYMVLAGLFNWQPGTDAGLFPGVLIGRAFSALLYVVAVVAAYRMAWLLTGEDERTAGFLAAAFALIPQVASTGASITADAFALASISVLGWASARAASRGWDRSSVAMVGLAAALVLMSRPTAMPMLIFPAVLLAIHAGRSARRWLTKGTTIAALAIIPNLWWMVRSLALFGEPFGSTAHVRAMAEQGIYTASNEFSRYKATEAGLDGLHDLLFSTDWLLRFHTRMWFTGRYEQLGLVGWALVGSLALGVGIALVVALRTTRPDASRLPAAAARVSPLTLLAVLAASATIPALMSLEYGAFVVGRFSTPVLGLFLIAAFGLLAATGLGGWGRRLAAAFAALMAVTHLLFWVGFLLPDLALEVLPT